MKYIAALLLALALLALPALAFVPTASQLPVDDIEKITDNMQSDYGYYSYSHIAVDSSDPNNESSYTPQFVYSGMLFGADNKDDTPLTDIQGNSYTAGVLANRINTSAWSWKANPDFNESLPVSVNNSREIFVEGVNSDITRQYVNQGGSMYIAMTPIGSDAERHVGYNEMGFTKTNFAWISSKIDQFQVEASSQGAIGGNYLQGVPNELSPVCQNAWLIERECDPSTITPITITAIGDADLKEAYAGSKSTASLKIYPSDIDSPANAKMSGYAERFAAYTDADVAGNFPANDPTATSWSDNEILMTLGNGEIENFWIGGRGLAFDAPDCEDFPDEFPSFGDVTWP
jgi:hypothetical protein